MTISTNIIKPNLFIVGAAKCGTTSLYYYLSQHPEVFNCPVKEPNHFITQFQIDSLYGNLKQYKKLWSSYLGLSKYLALYSNAKSFRITCDASVNYLRYAKEIAGKIKEFNDEAKILIILRNPVDRLFSHYHHSVRDGSITETLENLLTFEEEYCKMENNTWYSYKKYGLYYDNVKHYLDTFGQDKALILFNEDLESNPLKVLSNVCDFLMIDASFVPKIDFTKQNAAYLPKNPKISHLLNKYSQGSMLWSGLKKIFPIQFLRRLKIIINPLIPFQEKLSEEKTIQQLKAYYKEDITKLETLVNRDLSAWK
nr:sulfotransferase [uncultured Emticicia sp.]